jgi:hypothetical protein
MAGEYLVGSEFLPWLVMVLVCTDAPTAQNETFETNSFGLKDQAMSKVLLPFKFWLFQV